jgi:hypothetical protein
MIDDVSMVETDEAPMIDHDEAASLLPTQQQIYNFETATATFTLEQPIIQ